MVWTVSSSEWTCNHVGSKHATKCFCFAWPTEGTWIIVSHPLPQHQVISVDTLLWFSCLPHLVLSHRSRSRTRFLTDPEITDLRPAGTRMRRSRGSFPRAIEYVDDHIREVSDRRMWTVSGDTDDDNSPVTNGSFS